MEKFIEQMAEIMEVEEDGLSADTQFRDACDFDSLKGFSMICMIEEEYGKTVTVDQFLEARTIGALYEYTK